MLIDTQADADEYLELLIRYHMAKHKVDRETATTIQKENLAYFAEYRDNTTRERVERLFACAHPIFGRIAINGPPTSEQAFRMGLDLAKRHV
jgi:hypothetical protein